MRHLTKRALAELAGEDWNALPFGEPACGWFFHEMHDSVTGMIDVRAGLTPENQPTCPMCSVLLDQALEVAP